MQTTNNDLLKVENLTIAFGDKKVVENISFSLSKNAILGVVGESGSGKSITSLAIMGLLQNAKITGSVLFEHKDVLSYTPKEFQYLRGNEVSMVFQEPMSALNPSMKCGVQVLEVLLEHKEISNAEAKKRVLELFEKVKIPNPQRVFNAYPHELSGGQKQRIVIAMAIACKPKLLIADEPTTALDVTVQKEIIGLLKELQLEAKMSIIFISHDLSLVKEIADHTLVMYKGKMVEINKTDLLFSEPKSDYTKALILTRPSLKERLRRLPTVSDFLEGEIKKEVITKEERESMHKTIYAKAPLLKVNNVSKTFFSKTGWFTTSEFKAVDQVSFQIYEGETLGLVGESGCGKSTLGNVILQLTKADSGSVFYKGTDITKLSKQDLKLLRKEIQIIFQDPFSSLNPRMPIGKAIMEPMIAHNIYSTKKECKQKTLELLESVGLLREHFNRYPHEFSGGQRQRVGIARTIALKPKLIICDESVSALDISVQAQVLNLLNELKEHFGFTYIFISHDLAVVKYMADKLLVMNKGKIVETGESDSVYNAPKNEYTRKLIASIPKES